MGPGGISMRKSKRAAVPAYTKVNALRNYVLYMKRRKTGLIGGSGTMNNNIL